MTIVTLGGSRRLEGFEWVRRELVETRVDASTLAAGSNFTFVTSAGALDVIGDPAGTRGYDELVANAERVDIGGLEVLVADLDDLIRMKLAAGRPKDRIEVEILGALREERRTEE